MYPFPSGSKLKDRENECERCIFKRLLFVDELIKVMFLTKLFFFRPLSCDKTVYNMIFEMRQFLKLSHDVLWET